MPPRTPPTDGATDTSSASSSTSTSLPSSLVDAGKPAERKPMPEPEGGWPADEFTGKFGHYLRDPYTGVRSVDPDAPKYDPVA